MDLQYTREFKNLIESYDLLGHNESFSEEYVVVNWCLGNTCNYACSYCPDYLHDGSSGWLDYDTVKSFCDKVISYYGNKKIYFEFTGGEVTMWKDFPKIISYLKDNDVNVGLISNGSRTLRWWKENYKNIDHVSFSYHPEFADDNHYLEVVKFLSGKLKTHSNIMMDPDENKFKKGLKIAAGIIKMGDVSIALQPLIVDFQTDLYKYNERQQHILDNQNEIYCSKIKYTKEWPIYRGQMKIQNTNTDEELSFSPHYFISLNKNNWKGWYCYAGVEQLIVDIDGSVWRGWCKVGKQLGWVQRGRRLVFAKEPILCTKDFCHCNFDIMCTKVKP